MHFRCLIKETLRVEIAILQIDSLARCSLRKKKILSLLLLVLRQSPHVALLPLRSRDAVPHLHSDSSLLYLVMGIFSKISGPNFLFPCFFFFLNKLRVLFEMTIENSSGSRMHFLCLPCLG